MAKSRARVFADFISGNNVASIEYIASQANNLVLSIQEKLEVANAEAVYISNTDFQSYVANTNQYIALVGGEQSTQLVQQGILGVTSGVARWYAPANATITKVTSVVSTAPEGQPITVVINSENGEEQEMRIAPGTTNITNAASFDIEQFGFLTVDVKTVGTTTTGKDLNVQVFYRYR
jgi:hypothetical protein